MEKFKVVCIDTKPKGGDTNHPFIKGEIYTVIRTYDHFSKSDLNPCYVFAETEWHGSHIHFRPVQDIGDQVQEHINKLIKEEDFKTISV